MPEGDGENKKPRLGEAELFNNKNLITMRIAYVEVKVDGDGKILWIKVKLIP